MCVFGVQEECIWYQIIRHQWQRLWFQLPPHLLHLLLLLLLLLGLTSEASCTGPLWPEQLGEHVLHELCTAGTTELLAVVDLSS